MKGLIIGLGSIARKHILAMDQLEEPVELYALRSSRQGEKHAGVNDLFTYEEAEEINPDFILISNPTALHEATIKRLIDWNKPMLIEKPVLSSLENSDALSEALINRDLLAYVACNLRFLDCLGFVKRYLQGKRINEVNIYSGSYLPAWRPGTDFRKSYSALPELGGGVHLDLIHEIDYSYWLFGKPQEINALRRSRSTLAIPAIDYAHYTLGYDHFVATVTLNYFRRDYKRTAEFVLEGETILVDLKNNSVVNQEGQVLFESNQQITDTYLPQIKYFLGLVKTRQSTSMNTFQDGVEVLKICLHE